MGLREARVHCCSWLEFTALKCLVKDTVYCMHATRHTGVVDIYLYCFSNFGARVGVELKYLVEAFIPLEIRAGKLRVCNPFFPWLELINTYSSCCYSAVACFVSTELLSAILFCSSFVHGVRFVLLFAPIRCREIGYKCRAMKNLPSFYSSKSSLSALGSTSTESFWTFKVVELHRLNSAEWNLKIRSG